MPAGSFNDLLVTLLFVVPGGLGIALRKSIFATQAPSPFTEFLHSLAASLVALLTTEVAFGLAAGGRKGVGDFLLVPLARPTDFPAELDWAAYVTFILCALGAPAFGAWLRRTGPARRVFRTLSPHADGLDYLVHEARPQGTRARELWAIVNTEADEAFLGQIAWRSTAPDPLEVVLSTVRDMNDPEETEHGDDWLVWLPRESIRAIWVHVPPAEV